MIASPIPATDAAEGTVTERVLILAEDYRGSYSSAALELERTGTQTYADLARAVFSRPIFHGDAYVDAFRGAGVVASQVVPASIPLQRRWSMEHGQTPPSELLTRRPIRWLWTQTGRVHPTQRQLDRIVDAQVRDFRPTILWIFSGVPVRRSSVQRWRAMGATVVLWWSCALDETIPYDAFDLILSCIDPLVDEFRSRGIRTEHLDHAFDRRVLDRVMPSPEREERVAFVGNLTIHHRQRVEFLDQLSRHVPVDFYGSGVGFLPEDSPLRARAMGPAWGDDLYRVYGRYALVVHRNIDVAGSAASAKRLFEATGMGACLVVQDEPGLERLFDREREVAVFRSTDEAIDVIRDLLANPAAAARIGEAAQRRTLADHTYEARVAEFRRVVSQLTRGASPSPPR